MKLIPIKHKDRIYVAVISKSDWKRVKKHSWHIHFSRGSKKKVGQPYARATIGKKKVYLHRFVTGAYAPMHVDHKNHQTLDCRQDNLDVVTFAENMKRRRKRSAKRESANKFHHASILQSMQEGSDIAPPLPCG